MQESLAWRELGTRFADLGKDSTKDFTAEQTPDGQWLFTGVSDESTLKLFINAAERGAALLGCQPEALTVFFWLDAIKAQGSHYESGFMLGAGSHDEPGEYEERGFIRGVCIASAGYCHHLETRAIATERQPQLTEQSTVSSEGSTPLMPNRPRQQQPFPERAKWLKDRLKERGWNRNDPARHNGPDPKTVDRILSGAGVRADVLEKLANALSAKGGKVNPLDIPDD